MAVTVFLGFLLPLHHRRSWARCPSPDAHPQVTGLTLDGQRDMIARQVRHLCFPAQRRIVERMGDTRLHRVERNLIEPYELDEMEPPPTRATFIWPPRSGISATSACPVSGRTPDCISVPP